MAKNIPQHDLEGPFGPFDPFDPFDPFEARPFDPCVFEVDIDMEPEPPAKPKGRSKAKAKSKKKAGKSAGKRNKELGRRGEDAAVRFLLRKGYTILDRNWTCYAGEADIVALDDDTLVFVEVKTRHDAEKGFPSEAVNAKKREKYERIALIYVRDHGVGEVSVRFDVVSLVVVAPHRAMVRHHVGAFCAG